MSTRVAVVGAGAIGGYIGAHLARAGQNVVLIDAWPEHVEAMRRDGLRIKAVEKSANFVVPVKALHICDVPQLSFVAPIDIALISVKSYDTEWAASLILPYLSPTGCVVSVQNSINEQRIAEIAGWGRILGCSVGTLTAELIGPGRIVRSSPPSARGKIAIRVGEIHGRATERVQRIAQLLDLADSAAVTCNLWGERWSKLTINAMRNGVSAITGMNGKERDMDKTARALTIRLGSSSVRVGRAQGLALEAVSGLDLDLLEHAEKDPAAMRAITRQIIQVAKSRTDDQRPSMAQDIHKGRRTETDYINGLVARKGAELGVDASLHARVNVLVKRVESGELRPSLDLLKGL